MNAHTAPKATAPIFARPTIDASLALTGKHPADLLGLVDELRAALRDMGELFRAIDQANRITANAVCDTEQPHAGMQAVEALASLGLRVTSDITRYAECERADLCAALLDANTKKKGAAA